MRILKIFTFGTPEAIYADFFVFVHFSIIVDDLVQSGGTLQECAKELLRNGASCVSAYVTHAIFPKQSYQKFFTAPEHQSIFKYFWVRRASRVRPCPSHASCNSNHMASCPFLGHGYEPQDRGCLARESSI